jgi:hypothetical protein
VPSKPAARNRAYITGALIALIGAAAIAGTVVWRWGHLGYGLGVAALVVGVVIAVVRAVRGRLGKAVAGAATAAILIGASVLVAAGLPSAPPRWSDDGADGPSGDSATVGDLHVSDGTARDLRTGEVVWQFEDDGADVVLVGSGLVVFGTDEGTVGVETETGDELWRSPVTGRGIAHDEEILVVAHPTSDSAIDAVGLYLSTGATAWQRPGRPVMECALGPVDRFSPARESSHVLVIPDQATESRAELAAVSSGETTIADVDCSLTARVVGDVLIEAVGEILGGRALADGEQRWETAIERPWIVEGSGATVFTPTDARDDTSMDITAVDTATGQISPVEPPAGATPAAFSTLEARRTPDVWIRLDLESGEAALWNPDTDAIVDVPGAVSLEIEAIDAYSGWMALSGATQDLTGEQVSRCWALSPSGQLFGPVPGDGCAVDEALLSSSDGVYPLL